MRILRISHTDASEPNATPNLAGFDWLRVFAAFGVVWLHACVPYLKNPMPGLDWPVRDSSSGILDASFWAVEIFVMPVFLVIAGVLAWQSLQRRGSKALLSSRVKRLGKPLLFGLCVILPLDLYVWLAGWVYEGWIEPVKMKSLKIHGPLGDHLWGTSHLWFLVYLLTYVAALAGVYRITGNVRFRPFKNAAAAVPVALIIIGIITLCVRPNVVWGFQHAFAPVPSKWIYSASFFAGGVWLARRPHLFDVLKTHSIRIAAVATVLLIASVAQGRWHLQNHDPETSLAQFAGASLAVLTTTSAWAFTIAAMGLSLRYFHRTPRAIAYLAAASFWVYLVHHPLLGLIHIDLKFLLPGVASVFKGALAFGLAGSASLLTYESFVRKTRLGAWLGMKWSAPVEQAATPDVLRLPSSQSEVRRAA